MVRLCGLIFFLVFCSQTLADEQADLKALLEQRIIDPDLPTREVRAFTAARILPMPEVQTVQGWEKHRDRMRAETLEQVVFRGEAARWRDAETKVEWLDTMEGFAGYRIKKLRYEALPGLWIPALLYEPEKLEGKVPVCMNVNGHDGNGKAAVYKQIRCINQAKRGMLALNVEWLGMGQLTGENYVHYRMNQLDLCGTSGLAPFYLSMKRGLDLLLSLEHADPERVAVSGLSGGGWQTIIISSLDERVTLANPVAGYSSLLTRTGEPSDLGDSEQTPVDFATTTDYAQLTAMRAPRPTLLTYNSKDDCCFKADHALPPLLAAAGPIFKLYGKEANLRSHINNDPGTHNFEIDNRQQFYRMIGDHFYAGRKDFDATEIPCNLEINLKDDLHCSMPDENASFHSLALELMEPLPRQSELPTEKTQAAKWQTAGRTRLAEVIRAKKYDVQAIVAGEKSVGDVKATLWNLRLEGTWTVPAVELSKGKPTSTAILIADGGRATVASEAAALLTKGHRVLAVDPFYLGESKINVRDYLFALLVSAVGDRPLGLQASQVAAIARWARKEHSDAPVSVHALGPKSSLIALTAASLDDSSISGVNLSGSYGSLKEIIEKNMGANDAPELFCFGLLEQFDIRQLVALAAPRPVRFSQPSDCAKKELAGLDQWYATLGAQFDPLK
ncbi:MAG: acetylxylan esterase [Planctomycetaceae bacterium]